MNHTNDRHSTQRSRPLAVNRTYLRCIRRPRSCSKVPVHEQRACEHASVVSAALASTCACASPAWCMTGGMWLPCAPMSAMRCADTMQKQQQLSHDMVSSQPLTCTGLVVLAHLGSTCGTPPARARRAIKVRVEESRGRKCRARDFPSGAAAAARWRTCGVPQDRSRPFCYI